MTTGRNTDAIDMVALALVYLVPKVNHTYGKVIPSSNGYTHRQQHLVAFIWYPCIMVINCWLVVASNGSFMFSCQPAICRKQPTIVGILYSQEEWRWIFWMMNHQLMAISKWWIADNNEWFLIHSYLRWLTIGNCEGLWTHTRASQRQEKNYEE